ncbi:MAG: hypothetical protein N3C12_01395 [Candidatus Binatia bacterium]|nr:hypothetical protein [Candidatus Binatia bacterium]
MSARAEVYVVGHPEVGAVESEEFIICVGDVEAVDAASGARRMRTLSEGLIELGSREAVIETLQRITPAQPLVTDRKSFVILRTSERGKAFRVFRLPLFRRVEEDWCNRGGAIGRWVARVRATGGLASGPEALAIDRPDNVSGAAWERLTNASRKLAERFAAFGGGVGQVYDQEVPGFDTVREYLLAWDAALRSGEPALALAHTLEVQSLAGRTLGLMVLPSHCLRVAWHVAYDNLVLHNRFQENARPALIREEFSLLDSALVPPFLPGLQPGSTFVFADTLGFHSVAMVPDTDTEPKAAVATMAMAAGGANGEDFSPTVGSQSAQVLAQEIHKYLQCHEGGGSGEPGFVRILQLHALRAGDGLTVARALGSVVAAETASGDEQEEAAQPPRRPLAFALELYSSPEQRHSAGRFLAEAQEKRRKGAGSLAPEDRWLIESVALPHGVAMPRLRWAKRDADRPSTPAHFALAFDTFRMRVTVEPTRAAPPGRPWLAYGLLSAWERVYSGTPLPIWRSFVRLGSDGEKHPADRTHTERLLRLQQAVLRCVANHLSPGNDVLPVLRTEISPEANEALAELHRLCDWVITVDRNAGIEYFDSPREHPKIYEVYIIDRVPKRDGLGCLQLVTSTSNFEEVRALLDTVLGDMGLVQSRRNAEFLLDQLKAVSGRLAICLTGQRPPSPEIAALALAYPQCRASNGRGTDWPSLQQGFLVPLADVADVLPLIAPPREAGSARSAHADLLYVAPAPRRGLTFEWIRVGYRQHLRSARAAEFIDELADEVETFRHRWNEWIAGDKVPPSLLALRRARFVRVLRFYADRALRHHLEGETYQAILAELDRLMERGVNYKLAPARARVMICCPEYEVKEPTGISRAEVPVLLFGGALLPDWRGRGEVSAAEEPPEVSQELPALSPASMLDHTRDGGPDMDAEILFCADRDAVEPQHDGVVPAPEVVRIVLGAHARTGDPVVWTLSARGNPHLLVAGLPGMGKTASLVNLCTQMSLAGVRPVVYSYHQDINERLAALVPGVRFLDFEELSFNPLEIAQRDNPTAYLDVAGIMRDIFLAIFPDLRELQGERLREAIKQSFIECGWADVAADRAILQTPSFRRFFEILQNQHSSDRSLRGLVMRLQELADYGLFHTRGSTRCLWEFDSPLMLRIHRTQNERLQRAFASLVFYWLYKDMFGAGAARPDHSRNHSRRGSPSRTLAPHLHHGQGVPQVRDFARARPAGGTRLPPVAIFHGGELPCPSLERARRQGGGTQCCPPGSRTALSRSDQTARTLPRIVLQ